MSFRDRSNRGERTSHPSSLDRGMPAAVLEPTQGVMFAAARISVSAAVVLVLATAAGLAENARALTGPQRVTITAVRPSSSSAVIAWTVDMPSKVVVQYGVDTRFGVWSAPTAVANAGPGTTTLTGLEPGYTYQFRVVSDAGQGFATADGSFSTGPVPTNPQASITPPAVSTASTNQYFASPTAHSTPPPDRPDGAIHQRHGPLPPHGLAAVPVRLRAEPRGRHQPLPRNGVHHTEGTAHPARRPCILRPRPEHARPGLRAGAHRLAPAGRSGRDDRQPEQAADDQGCRARHVPHADRPLPSRTPPRRPTAAASTRRSTRGRA